MQITPPRVSGLQRTTPTLFLDFDGTLHPLASESALQVDESIRFCWRPLLEATLAAYPAVRIVVTSDWRHFCDDHKLREHLGPLGSRLAGVTGVASGHLRVDYILDVVNLYSLEHWCALDDDPSIFDASIDNPRFIWCDPSQGLAATGVHDRFVSWLARHGNARTVTKK